MQLESVLEPSLTRDRLMRLASSQRCAHLYLFVAPVEDVASAVAKAFLLDWLGASSIQKTHPDLFELCCSGKAGLHSVSRIRDLLEDLSLSPHMSRGRAVLIHSAERMLPASSNTLLKALEEPPPRTIIVLVTSFLQKILPTIVSRAQIVRIQAVPKASEINLEAVLDAPSYRTIYAFTEKLAGEMGEERCMLEKELLAAHAGEDLTASARHEVDAEIEAALTLWSQKKAQKMLEETYLVLRSRQTTSLDLSKNLLQALKAIERGSDFKRIFPLFLSSFIL